MGGLHSLVIAFTLLFSILCPTISTALLPLPFYRSLSYSSSGPLLCGSDVAIAQNLLSRSGFVSLPSTSFTGCYDSPTAQAVGAFQYGHEINVTSIFDLETTAAVLLAAHLDDLYEDDGQFPMAANYKVHLQVVEDRRHETIGRIVVRNVTVGGGDVVNEYYYIVRTQGVIDPPPSSFIRNALTSDGETPTGLATFDLNSPESDPKSFGPFPINRVVEGLRGNTAIFFINQTDWTYHPLLSTIRTGILQHTGEWDGWNASMPMPNSNGCVHGHPVAIETVWQLLIQSGTIVNKNPDAVWPYPYRTQGLFSLERIHNADQQHIQDLYKQRYVEQEARIAKGGSSVTPWQPVEDAEELKRWSDPKVRMPKSPFGEWKKKYSKLTLPKMIHRDHQEGKDF